MAEERQSCFGRSWLYWDVRCIQCGKDDACRNAVGDKMEEIGEYPSGNLGDYYRTHDGFDDRSLEAR